MNSIATYKAFRVEEQEEKFVSIIKEMPFEPLGQDELLSKYTITP
ncbi:hypothetical protein HNP99_000729 [Flavobacterium sp. 28A]|nr:hypothetical protein [Flavobacterium sp. 28A]NRT14389.1 hypothetical protein [Flavobacterium sp. 28A]